MKMFRHLIIISLVYPGFLLNAQEITTYSGQITLGDDTRILQIEFNENDVSATRYSIEGSGRHRIPVSEPQLDPKTGIFTGGLPFIGEHSHNSVWLESNTQGLDGYLIWRRDTIHFNLKKEKLKLPYREESISVQHGNLTLNGTLIVPQTTNEKFPVVVFVHGSGPATRWWGLYWAKEFSKMGVASLLYDKRGCGTSMGPSWVNSSLDDLAFDVTLLMRSLESHPKIDRNKIGLYGVSQGGWIAGRVATMYKPLSFIMVNSGGGVSPYQEELFSYENNMKYAGIDEAGRSEGLQLVEQYMNYLGSGDHRAALESNLQLHRDKPWFPVLGLDRILVSEKNRLNWEWVATYEPLDDIKNMKAPVLLLFGDQDHQQPTNIAVAEWRKGLKMAGNEEYRIRVFEGAGHALSVGGHHAPGFPSYAEGHLQEIAGFLKEYVLNASE